MPEKVDLYNTSYGNSEVDVYSEVRRETYGIDLGLTSWVSAEELAEIPRLLQSANRATSSKSAAAPAAARCILARRSAAALRELTSTRTASAPRSTPHRPRSLGTGCASSSTTQARGFPSPTRHSTRPIP